MLNDKQSVDLTRQELEVIEAALHTQEKILSVQSKAGSDPAAATKLTQLQGVLRSIRRQSPVFGGGTWTGMARAFFG